MQFTLDVVKNISKWRAPKATATFMMSGKETTQEAHPQ